MRRVSASTPPQKPQPKLSVTLKRKHKVRPLGQEDLKWLWASYVKGDFKGLIDEGLDVEGFKKAIALIVTRVDDLHIIEGDKPVGVVSSIKSPTHDWFEAHVVWFNWATPRDIFCGATAFLSKMRKKRNYLLFIEEKNKKFYTRIAAHGIIRRVGTVHSSKSAVFETKRVKNA
jgi:hypothetical protein